jgi:cytochrome c biogenesis protein CcmG/thiol:disulfide interchange protein DsbE
MNRSERRRATVRPSRVELETQARRRRTIIYGSLVALAVIAIATVIIVNRNGSIQTASNATEFAKISVGQAAPPFSAATTDGPFDSTKAGGKPILLEAFATWCPHCQREVPILNSLNAKYKGKADVVGVSASPLGMDQATPESQADVVAFMQRFGVRYPIAFDPDLDVAHKYLQGGFPTIVLIGKDGKIEAFGSGEIPAQDLQRALDAAIAGKPVDPYFGQKKT